MLETIIIIGLLVLNFAISAFNAWSVGKGMADAKAVGGWANLMIWAGGIMSASGFTWVYLIIIGFGVTSLGILDQKTLEGMLSLGYLIIIFPVLGSGLMIMIDSWLHFYRERSLSTGGIMAWNTFAQAYNTYEAISAIPDAFENVFNLFGGDDSENDSAKAKIVLIIVVFALVGGILTTIAIARMAARSHSEGMIKKMQDNRYRQTA